MNKEGLLIFDMDGVLVDVGESYRETIRLTVEHFTGVAPSAELIQQFKNKGGWNDDWNLSDRLIKDAGVQVDYKTVIAEFQKIFRGENGNDGLILRERWTAHDGLFDRLGDRHRLAVFTGRYQEEAQVTLTRFAPGVFDPVIGADNVMALKPDPDGLRKILGIAPAKRVFYFGDTVDDIRSANAAGVAFIGVVGRDTPRRDETVKVLMSHGAMTVLSSVNEIEEAIEER